MNLAQIESLWTSQGGDPRWAPLMAGIALAESSGDTTALNNTPSTGDYSVGLWQINYYGPLLPGRTAEYGSPSTLQGSPPAQAKAAIALFGNGAGASNWTNDRVWNQWKAAGFPQYPSTATVTGWVNAAGVGTGSASAGGSGVTVPGANAAGGDNSLSSQCVLNIPIVGCVLNQGQVKALKGGMLMAAGGGIMAVGVMILAAFAFKDTAAGRAAKGAINATPIGGAVKGLSSSSGGGAKPKPAPSTGPTPPPIEVDGQQLDADERRAYAAGGPDNVRKFRGSAAA